MKAVYTCKGLAVMQGSKLSSPLYFMPACYKSVPIYRLDKSDKISMFVQCLLADNMKLITEINGFLQIPDLYYLCFVYCML